MCAALYCACSECMSEWVCERSKIVQLVFRWWIGLARSFICITVEIALACIFIWSLCMCVVVSCYCDANYYYSYIVDHIERRKRRWTETKRNTHIQQHIRNYHSRQGIWNKNGVIQSGAHCLFLFVGNKNKFEKKNELNKNGAFSEASKWSILCNNDDTCSIKYPLSMTVCEPRWLCRPCVCVCVCERARASVYAHRIWVQMVVYWCGLTKWIHKHSQNTGFPNSFAYFHTNTSHLARFGATSSDFHECRLNLFPHSFSCGDNSTIAHTPRTAANARNCRFF